MISHKTIIPYSIALGLILLVGITTSIYFKDMLKLDVVEASNEQTPKPKQENKKQAMVEQIMNSYVTPTASVTKTPVQEVASYVADSSSNTVNPTPTSYQANNYFPTNALTATPTPLFQKGINLDQPTPMPTQAPTPSEPTAEPTPPLVEVTVTPGDNGLPVIDVNVNLPL